MKRKRRDRSFWYTLAEKETQATLRALPAELRERVAGLPVLFEDLPGPALLDAGWPDDLMGFFEGAIYADEASSVDPLPPSIRLFIANIREEAEDDPDVFREEVRTTLMHELGHYLGLDEDELAARGIE